MFKINLKKNNGINSRISNSTNSNSTNSNSTNSNSSTNGNINIIPYSIIPLNIFQTWSTLDLLPYMKINREKLIKQNPEFTHYLYDDDMCRKFISENFEEDILYTFNKLKPGAYKADLWRYCILYKKGGIYLDIKYSCVNGFKLIYLTDKEYYVRDRTINNINCGIYNGLIVSLPYNNSLLKAIYNIV